MAEEKEESKGSKKTEKELVAVKPSVDFPVTVISQDADPYHKTGAEWECGLKTAEKLEAAGWVKIKKK